MSVFRLWCFMLENRTPELFGSYFGFTNCAIHLYGSLHVLGMSCFGPVTEDVIKSLGINSRLSECTGWCVLPPCSLFRCAEAWWAPFASLLLALSLSTPLPDFSSVNRFVGFRYLYRFSARHACTCSPKLPCVIKHCLVVSTRVVALCVGTSPLHHDRPAVDPPTLQRAGALCDFV